MKLNASASTPPRRELADIAARLDHAGAHGFYFAELMHDPFLDVALAAPGSQQLNYGTAIALAFTRSPTTLAYIGNDLQAATGGRFVMGLGTQIKPHIERRFGLTWDRPVQRFRETVLAMRAVWEGWATDGKLSFEGEIFNLSLMTPAFTPEPAPGGPPPVYLAAVGPQMAELAGEVADGLFVHAFTTADYVRNVILPAVERGLAKSGRKRADFKLCLSAFIADTTQPDADPQARSSVAFYASTPDYVGVLEQHGLEGLQPKLRQMTREGQWEAMAGEIGDEVLDLFCISGDPAELSARMGDRWSGLVDEVSIPVEYWLRHADNAEWKAGSARLMDAG
jgi:probable F420-dependent oxidoreductase